MEKILRDFTYKANRFIDALAKRRDVNLNSFFKELAVSLQKISAIAEETASEFGMHEYEKSILRFENIKLRLMLSLFTSIKPEDVIDDNLIYIRSLVGNGYLTAKTFYDIINQIDEIECLMKILYPKKNNKPKTISELKNGVDFLNKKLNEKFKPTQTR